MTTTFSRTPVSSAKSASRAAKVQAASRARLPVWPGRGLSPALVVRRLGKLLLRQITGAPLQRGSDLQRQPVHAPLPTGGVAERVLPIDLGNPRRGLDRALDQQTVAIAALRGAGDLAGLPKQIERFRPGETLPGRFAERARAQLGGHARLRE